ncbi:hypothetical protein CLOM_g18731 [Closterium sp. NIES-68]|nr:hypothetical protein CLOM_g18731 [Closterium sp. NIES-68]GJP74754.1 hypothetical protein CLOP_g5294 [Closterium sp. NIES-67]
MPHSLPALMPLFLPALSPLFLPALSPLFFPTLSFLFLPAVLPLFLPALSTLFLPALSPLFLPALSPLFLTPVSTTSLPAVLPHSLHPSRLSPSLSPRLSKGAEHSARAKLARTGTREGSGRRGRVSRRTRGERIAAGKSVRRRYRGKVGDARCPRSRSAVRAGCAKRGAAGNGSRCFSVTQRRGGRKTGSGQRQEALSSGRRKRHWRVGAMAI